MFGRHERLSGRSFRVVYADDDPNPVVHEELADSDDLGALPKDGLPGAGAVEIALTNLLRRRLLCQAKGGDQRAPHRATASV